MKIIHITHFEIEGFKIGGLHRVYQVLVKYYKHSSYMFHTAFS